MSSKTLLWYFQSHLPTVPSFSISPSTPLNNRQLHPELLSAPLKRATIVSCVHQAATTSSFGLVALEWGYLILWRLFSWCRIKESCVRLRGPTQNPGSDGPELYWSCHHHPIMSLLHPSSALEHLLPIFLFSPTYLSAAWPSKCAPYGGAPDSHQWSSSSPWLVQPPQMCLKATVCNSTSQWCVGTHCIRLS